VAGALGPRKPARATELAGVIAATFEAPCNRPAGIAWDSGHLWLVCAEEPPTIYKLDGVTLAVLDSFAAPAAEFAFGLEHDGTQLWGDSNNPDRVYRVSDADGTLLDEFPVPFGDFVANGIAWGGSAIWESAFLDDLKRLDPVIGAVLHSLSSPGGEAPRGLAWFLGELWVVDANLVPTDAIYRLDPADGSVIDTFQPTGAELDFPFDLAWDGTDFWLTDLGTDRIHRLSLNLSIFADGFELLGGACVWSAHQGLADCCP
jgi:hypothetical protein